MRNNWEVEENSSVECSYSVVTDTVEIELMKETHADYLCKLLNENEQTIKQLEEEVMEQCRINARGQERELMLMAKNEDLKRQLQIKQYQVDIADESYSIVINERINERLKK